MTPQDIDTLTWVAGLDEFLAPSARKANANHLWTLVKLIEVSLAADHRCSAGEKTMLRQIKEGVRQAIDSRRDGHRPEYFMARLPLAELRKSIEGRA